MEIIKGIVLCSNEMKQFCWPLGNANMEAAKHEKKPIVGLETRDYVEHPEKTAHMIEVSRI